MGFREPQHVRRSSRFELPAWSTTILLALFVVGVMGLGYFTFNAVKKFVAGSEVDIITGPEGDNPEGGDAEEVGSAGDPLPANWTEGRVTVLLLGIDERKLEHGPWRTDTMILLTVDPVSQTAGMISFPRDLWVEIANYDGLRDRINTAHFRGDADNYPGGGGPALAMETILLNFGIPVDYYVSVNFYAFVQVIDRLDCVPMTVPQTIDDPNYPAAEGTGFDPFHIEAGDHCMGGETLLKYARTRATFGSDFDRAARQQQVILAVRDHVLDTGRLPALITQANEIYGDVEAGVNTNLSMEQIIALAQMAAGIPEDRICTAVISGPYVESLETLPDGSQVIIWDDEAVRQLISDIFNGTGVCAPGTVDLASAALEERAAISVVNGTPQEGLATDTGDQLTAAGLNVVFVGNADRFDYSQTVIYDYTGKTATARYVAQLLGLPESAVIIAEPSTTLYDIQIVLGADYLNNQ